MFEFFRNRREISSALRNYNLQPVVGGAVRQKVTGLAGLSGYVKNGKGKRYLF
jgi:hypothetical protein